MKPIILIGMMGSGKTTIGSRLSHTLNLSLLDTDVLIEETTKRKISDIFSIYGESYFRACEHDALTHALHHASIISTGGGIITNKKNDDLLRQGTVIYLKTDLTVLHKRIDTKDRPLLAGKDVLQTLQSIYSKRATRYEQFATVTIDTTNLSIFEVTQAIVSYLNMQKDKETV